MCTSAWSDPQILAVTDLAFDGGEDKPAGFIGVPVILLTLVLNQALLQRIEQGGQAASTVVHRSQRQVEPMTAQVLKESIGRPAEVGFVQQQSHPHREVEKVPGTISASMPRQADNVPATFSLALYLPHSLQQTATICRASRASCFRVIP